MASLLLLLVVGALVVGAIGFGVAALVSGGDPGLDPAEPDGRAVPLPAARPLVEADVAAARFDTAVRGYRMSQVDAALRRMAYDTGYKDELIGVLEAEVAALREGRMAVADELRRARGAALAAAAGAAPPGVPAELELGSVAHPAAGAPAAEPSPAGPAGGASEPESGTDRPDWSVEADDSWRRQETKLP